MISNGYIANSRFTFVKHPGTGNKSCKVALDEKLRLSNILVDAAAVNEFLNALCDTGERKVAVKLSTRRTSRRWGSAWTLQRRCTLYRHTVWVMLHEIAHLLDIKKEYTGYTVAARKPHGPDFGRHLARMYDLWKRTCDKGICNEPVKKDSPDLDNDYFPQTPELFKVPQRRARLVGGISLQVGDGVWFNARGSKIFARVIKVNKKTCRVKPIDGTPDWRVSPKLLNKTYLPKDAAMPKPKVEVAPQPRKKQRSQADIDLLKAWKAKYRRR